MGALVVCLGKREFHQVFFVTTICGGSHPVSGPFDVQRSAVLICLACACISLLDRNIFLSKTGHFGVWPPCSFESNAIGSFHTTAVALSRTTLECGLPVHSKLKPWAVIQKKKKNK